ncbi:hypothetical protein HOLleu_11727 [Holothuria leucospilota]|uniref:Uncharacterized protein n=1 Tax=Holothuria leucospilota TaxID=206669 RepID=A0A9Q1HGM9_HOLLE|nr:hypothetical protein HOLleu_11727 [Holothuria leucospilota]
MENLTQQYLSLVDRVLPHRPQWLSGQSIRLVCGRSLVRILLEAKFSIHKKVSSFSIRKVPMLEEKWPKVSVRLFNIAWIDSFI